MSQDSSATEKYAVCKKQRVESICNCELQDPSDDLLGLPSLLAKIQLHQRLVQKFTLKAECLARKLVDENRALYEKKDDPKNTAPATSAEARGGSSSGENSKVQTTPVGCDACSKPWWSITCPQCKQRRREELAKQCMIPWPFIRTCPKCDTKVADFEEEVVM